MDVNLDFSLEPSLLATFGLDGLDAGISDSPTSNPPHHRDQDQHQYQGHNHDNAARNELLTPDFSFPRSSLSASASASAPHTVTAYDEAPTPGLQLSALAASRTPSLVNYMTLSSSDDDTEYDEKSLTGLVFWTDKMAQLNTQFTQHLQSIPHVSSKSLQNNKNGDIIPLPSGNHDPDRTFHLSESFIDILSGMCSKEAPTHTGTTVADEDSPAVFLSLDESSYLMVFSTYLRFLETHDSVFRYLLACLSHKRESIKTGSCFYLPKLTIGSFSPAMTSDTRPLLFVSLMESMLTRARNFVHHMTLVKSGSSPPVIEPDSALRAIRAKETAISTSIERIKSALSRMQ